MEMIDLISNRLGGPSFYLNSYYKFEKYSKLKESYLKEHKDSFILDFGIGEGNDLPPSDVLYTLSKECFVHKNRVYSDNGIDEFKFAASNHLKKIYNVEIKDPINQINHCIGAKSALTILPFALIEENDVIISTTPGYEVLANIGSWLKAKIYKVPLLKENNYLIDLDKIPEEIYKRCKIFSINYPNNPTGAVANKKFYEKLVKLALKYNFLIVNDAAYGPFTYKKNPLSIFNVKNAFDCAIEIHTLSKAYNMTGMRIGFVVGNEKIIDIFKKVKDNIDSGQYIPIQLAGIRALNNCDLYLEKLKNKYYNRLKNISRILNKHNLKCEVSKGTFYLYVKVPSTFKSADELTRFLLSNAGIFTIPFDEVEPYIRLSMTFNVLTNENDFYLELDNRLNKLKY